MQSLSVQQQSANNLLHLVICKFVRNYFTISTTLLNIFISNKSTAVIFICFQIVQLRSTKWKRENFHLATLRNCFSKVFFYKFNYPRKIFSISFLIGYQNFFFCTFDFSFPSFFSHLGDKRLSVTILFKYSDGLIK